MNIGLVIISVPGGGAETVVYNLHNHLSKKGHKVTLIANEEFFTWDPPINCDKINLKHLLDPKFIIKSIFGIGVLPKIIVEKKKLIIPILLDVYFKKEIKHIIRDITNKKIDVLHFHDPYGLKIYKHLSKISDIPCIYTFHGKDIDLYFYTKGAKHNFIKIVNSINAITTVSKSMKDYLVSNGIRSDINVISNGIDFEQINNIIKSNPEVNYDKKYTIIFSGGQKKNKGGEILLEAIKIVKNQNDNIKLYYCGFVNNDFMKKYQDKDVIFTGYKPYKEYLKLLSTCDCLISLSKEEAFPLAILEAMGFGKIILTTPVGGIPEFFIDGVNGFFVERDPQRIAEKIIVLMNNQNILINISKNNIQYAKKFQWNNIADQYIKAYKQIIPPDIKK